MSVPMSDARIGAEPGRRKRHSLFEDDTLVDHAVRMWQAETQNAERFSRRVALLFSIIVALFGLGLFKVEWYRNPDEMPSINYPWAECAIRSLLGIALLFVAAAFWWLLARRSPPATQGSAGSDKPAPGASASWLLAFDDEYLRHPGVSLARARKAVFKRTYVAATDLAKRNIKEKNRIDTAQRLLMIGLSFVLLALLLFIATSVPQASTTSTI